jgi:hypothetical protein
MNGSARDMLAWVAANDPARLAALAAMAALTPDDPELDHVSREIRAEARRRVLELIAGLQQAN